MIINNLILFPLEGDSIIGCLCTLIILETIIMKKSFLFLTFFGIATFFSYSKGMENPYSLTNTGSLLRTDASSLTNSFRNRYVNPRTKEIVIAALGELRLEILGIKQEIEVEYLQYAENQHPYSYFLECVIKVTTTLEELKAQLYGIIDEDINDSIKTISKNLEELHKWINNTLSQNLSDSIMKLLDQIEQDHSYLYNLQLEYTFLTERDSLISELVEIYDRSRADLEVIEVSDDFETIKKVKLEKIIIRLNDFIKGVSIKIEEFLDKLSRKSDLFALTNLNIEN